MRSLSTDPTPPRNCPSPKESGRNSWRSKKRGNLASATSTLPNLMPPAAWPSPAVSHPSPPDEAPPPAPRGRGAAPPSGVEETPDEGPRGVGVLPRDREAKASRPAGQRALGA